MALGPESGAETFVGKNRTIITAAATTQIKAAPGKLAKIIITTAPTALNVYDSASDDTNKVFGIVTIGVYDLQIPMDNGIRVVHTGTALMVVVWT